MGEVPHLPCSVVDFFLDKALCDVILHLLVVHCVQLAILLKFLA